MPKKRSHLSTVFVVCLVSLVAGGKADPGPQLRVARSTTTGNASFVTGTAGAPIEVESNTAAPQPADFWRQYGHLFGIASADEQLRPLDARRDNLGFVHSEFEQVHRGVRVFGGRLRTHQNASGAFVAAGGEFMPVPGKLDVQPALGADHVRRKVMDIFSTPNAQAQHLELVIVDPAWYGDRPQGPRLAYYVLAITTDDARGFFIDAQSGRLLDQWSLLETARNRRIHNANGSQALPGPVARIEGQGPHDDAEVNRLYDYAGDTYDYFWRAFARDGINDLGMMMIATVNSTAPSCPNAFWNGTQTVYCTGLTHDDVVGHEFTHAVTQYTAGLIYQNQPGQLNESYSDVFGELIDLFNGDGSSPGAPIGPPWPPHPSGPGVDDSNELRSGCVGGVRLDVLSPAPIAGFYPGGQAVFGPQLDLTGVIGPLVAAVPPHACTEISNSIAGKVALIDRGSCNFDLKVFNAQLAGATAVVVANNREGPLPFLSGSGEGVKIPSLGISQADGNLLREAMANGEVVVRLAANDGSAARWLVAEDGQGNQFRDMWRPSCLGDPDSANHEFQTCSAFDNGGVHSGSGVPNHAFALVTDGGSFREYTVEGIGPIKSGAVWYRALTTYLTEVSDFEDAFVALNQAASDLVGTFPLDPRTGFPSDSMFSAHDAAQINLALEAVEMNTPGRCGSFEFVLSPDDYVVCKTPTVMYSDDFEQGTVDWLVTNSGPPTPYNWMLRARLPWGMVGTGWFAADPEIGDCQSTGEAGLHTLTSPLLFIWDEAEEFYVSFVHLVATEPAFDGGNVKISVNEGPFELVPPEKFRFNGYNAEIPKNSLNPLAGEPAFTGRGAVWGTSFIELTDLANPGDLVQFRFDFGKDQCGGHDGWYLSDISLFYCVPEADGDFDNDDKVTLADFAHMQICLRQTVRDGGPCASGDLDGNGVIQLKDVGLFVELLDDP